VRDPNIPEQILPDLNLVTTKEWAGLAFAMALIDSSDKSQNKDSSVQEDNSNESESGNEVV